MNEKVNIDLKIIYVFFALKYIEQSGYEITSEKAKLSEEDFTVKEELYSDFVIFLLKEISLLLNEPEQKGKIIELLKSEMN